MKSKAQYSVEFLYTYGWAFGAILITIGALYMLGVFDFGDNLPQRCVFHGQMECDEYYLYDDGAGSGFAAFYMLNNFGARLMIVNATLFDTDEVFCDFVPANHLRWNISDATLVNLTGCSGSTFLSGERFNGQIEIVYYRNSTYCDEGVSPDGDCTHRSYGLIDAIVN